MASLSRTSLQHRVWRWHFFAGLMVVPFAVILAVTGGVYLFKPQFEAAVERNINARADTAIEGQALTSGALVHTATQHYPGAQFRRLTLPRSDEDRTYEVELRIGGQDRVLWLDQYTGDILHDTPKDRRLMNIAQDIHGNLLAGNRGSYLVELMAGWMIVLMVTGLFLHWPRGTPWRDVLFPSLRGQPVREVLRRLHGAIGVWISTIVLALLISGLPWTQVWGGGFDRVQEVMGWDGPGQEWVVTLQSGAPTDGLDLWQRGAGEESDVTLQSGPPHGQIEPAPLDHITDRAMALQLKSPVEIQPPKGDNGVWTVRSMTQNRPHRATVHFDRWTTEEVMRVRFTDYHPVKQVASYGIAFHEGALFGPLNQALGVVAALGVITLSVSGVWMWWKRRPAMRIGIPPMPSERHIAMGVVAIILILGAFLPLVGLSLAAFLAVDVVLTALRKQDLIGL
ncbi:MAG: PepSY domain-containing protein [Pseudomonadota bacterium]